jgi:DNA-binding GntR family transcriptional regulator
VKRRPAEQPLSERQQQVFDLARRYYGVSDELPSSGWLARRLAISPQRARQHLDILRSRGWLDPRRLRGGS